MNKVRLLPPAYAAMVIVIFALPFFGADGYSLVRHTTSQLGAQHTPNAWVMNLVFLLLGLAAILDGWPAFRGFPFHQGMLFVFGCSLALTGLFHHAPIDETVPFRGSEDWLHSLFARTTGFSFTVLAVATGLIERTRGRKAAALVVGFLATALSVLMASVEACAGIWQRMIFVGCFAWLIYTCRIRVLSGTPKPTIKV